LSAHISSSWSVCRPRSRRRTYLLGKLRSVNGGADGAKGMQMDTDTGARLEAFSQLLAGALHDLLGLTFGPRGYNAKLGNWEIRLDHQLFGWDPTIHNVTGGIYIPFTLPRIDSTNDDDESSDILF
jgi:hypothetical protein